LVTVRLDGIVRRWPGPGAEPPANQADRCLDLLGPGGRDVVDPERVGEALRRNAAPVAEDQRGEHSSLARTE
jgi:hypothetical protein